MTEEVFEDELVSIGTAVLANITGSGGTLVIERKMDSSGNWVEISSETVTAGTPLVLNYDFPLLEARAKVYADKHFNAGRSGFFGQSGRE